MGSGDIKPLAEHKKRELELTEEDKEKERKRKKNEKREVIKKEKQQEQDQRQKGWQSFAKKSTKKGVKIPGVSGELHLSLLLCDGWRASLTLSHFDSAPRSIPLPLARGPQPECQG